MKKWALLLFAATIISACSAEENMTQDELDEHAHHHNHEGTYYNNEQLQLNENVGERPLTFPPILEPVFEEGNQVTYELTAQQGKMSFINGIETDTYGYNGDFLGPVIRLKEGQQVTMKLTNTLPDATTFHWHGLEVAGDASDGGPHAVIEPGTTDTIEFTVNQKASTLWYHPHPMGYTAEQVYKGLAGLLYIDDANSEQLQLPRQYGENDFPIILQDRTFVNGQIDYEQAANTMSTLGDTIMINGTINPYLTAPREKVRLRILNGSNALTYHLSLENEMPFELIATDGGFVNKPVEMTALSVGAGERVELLIDLSKVNGNTISLMNNDTALLPIKIEGNSKNSSYDTSLNDLTLTDELINMKPTKQITMEGMTENFLINGKTFDMDRIDFRQKKGVTEIWEVENVLSEEGAMAHPFHIHGTQFLVVSVNGETPDPSLQGYKDTITVQPMQKVRIAVKFPEKGIYMFHCHILEHEDVGMMGQIEVYE